MKPEFSSAASLCLIEACAERCLGMLRPVVGALLLVAAGAFAGEKSTTANAASAGERPDATTPAAVSRTTSWSFGWKVLHVNVWRDASLENAHVDLETPEGRQVTLPRGLQSKEGVQIERIEWAGAPIPGRVTLRKATSWRV